MEENGEPSKKIYLTVWAKMHYLKKNQYKRFQQDSHVSFKSSSDFISILPSVSVSLNPHTDSHVSL